MCSIVIIYTIRIEDNNINIFKTITTQKCVPLLNLNFPVI